MLKVGASGGGGAGGAGGIGAGTLGVLHMSLIQYSCILRIELLTEKTHHLDIPVSPQQFIGVEGVRHPVREAPLKFFEKVFRNLWESIGFHIFYSAGVKTVERMGESGRRNTLRSL
jgi:hypothetical protein